ncbi:VWA domain-containing protein [Acidipila sp. EB88]|uniref:VWA domain-containing protein n=1 Tax=Acidipila sp. EB88 TaxID=2305226 RepID=UPI000F5F38D4|nr:VWA domain-containing protein [Acidipila sp. EB88]RRA48338.1 VWA domain-containing protein [Acidipila sp. EB88]
MKLLKSFALLCLAALPLVAAAPAPRACAQAPTPATQPGATPATTQPQSQPQSPAQSSTPAATQPQPAAQQAAPAPQDNAAAPGFTLRSQVNEVYLTFAVTDRHGHFIDNLKQSDFALLDDGKTPAQVYRFEQDTNLPLRVGIVIDTSTSIRQRFAFEQQAANEFLLQILRPKSDKAFVEGFDLTPDFKQDWTNNLDLLTTGIDGLHSGGGTALYDALYTGCHNKMLDATEHHEPARKAIVVISDGDDNQSHAYIEDAIKECQRAETSVYAISTNVSPSRDRGDDTLQKIADATGGRAFYPTRIEDMPISFTQIQQELRTQYSLSYKPADFSANGAFRTIYLFCLDRRYQVRSRTGYFAPRP